MPLLPRSIDNNYRGSTVAIWLFVPLIVMKIAIAIGCIFNGRNAAQSADGIPLDTFGAAAAQAVVSMFAAWGLSQVIIGAIAVLVLIRYRAMLPFMFTLLLFEHVARKLIFYMLPVVKNGTPPGFYINAALFAAEIAGLTLSLWPRRGLVVTEMAD